MTTRTRIGIVLATLLVLGVTVPLLLINVGGGSKGVRTEQASTTRAP